MPKFLIFQGSPSAMQDEIAAVPGGKTNTALFEAALTDGQAQMSARGQATDAIETFTLNAADLEQLPQGLAITDFDGVIITGSPLNAYKDEPAVRHQLDLARTVYNSGVPTFGSCWGVQIMCAALGGTVHLNPRGREFGIARAIGLTEAGRAHDLYRDKATAFDALCSHEDEVATLPENATLLASNEKSMVQAIDVTSDGKSFWGVQYHPEFDFGLVAALLQRRTARQLADGYAKSRDDVAAVVADFHAMDQAVPPSDLVWKYGLTDHVAQPGLRRREFRNWLERRVYPGMAQRR